MAASDEDVTDVTRTIIDNWEAIGVEERDGVLYMPASIKRRTKDGALEETPVCLRRVTNQHRFLSRTASRAWATDVFKLDLVQDADLVSELENYCILAFAIRDPDSLVQHVPDGPTLFQLYAAESLSEVWGRYDAWVRMLDPRFGQWDAEQLWRVIGEVQAKSSIAPLAVMPGIEQASCMLFMAREACCSPNAPSWLRSSGTSTPEGSP